MFRPWHRLYRRGGHFVKLYATIEAMKPTPNDRRTAGVLCDFAGQFNAQGKEKRHAAESIRQTWPQKKEGETSKS
jgi:hypothetical protein